MKVVLLNQGNYDIFTSFTRVHLKFYPHPTIRSCFEDSENIRSFEMFQIPRNAEFNFVLGPWFQDIATYNLEINLTLMSISDENQIFYVGFNQSILNWKG